MARRRAAVRDLFGWQDPIIDKDLSVPPGSPSEGDRYIVGPSATGAWSGHADDIAEYSESAWEFYSPEAGWRVDILDESKQYRYSGSAWILVGEGGGGDGQKTENFLFTTQVGPYSQSSAVGYETLGRFMFRGTTQMTTPSNIKAVAWRESGSNGVDIRIYDITNIAQICEKTGITDADPTIQDMGTLANLPTGEAIWEFQMKTGTGTKGRVSMAQIQY